MKTFIRCTQSEFIEVTLRSIEKVDAARAEWTYLEMPSSHVPIADMPEQSYRTMLSYAGR